MDKKDREFMLSIAKRLGEIESDLRTIKGSKPILSGEARIAPPPSRLPNASKAANKFFGGEVAQTEPQCSVECIFKANSIPPESDVLQEVENGQKMLRKAVMEFCEEFDIEEFNINYKDPTPKKKE